MTEIRLAARPGNRVLAAIGAFLISWIELLLVVVLIWIVGGGEGYTALRLGGLAVVLLLLAATTLALARLVREVFVRAPRVVVESGRLVVHHPVFLRKPYPVDRDDLLAVSIRREQQDSWWGDEAPLVVDALVDEGLADGYPHADHPDLDYEIVEDEHPDLDARTRLHVPAITHDPKETSNVAVHLGRSTRLDDYRRLGLSRTITGKPWPEMSTKTGFLLSVQDLDAFVAAMRAWGAERKFGLRQVELLRPSPDDLKRERRQAIGGVIFLLYGVALIVRWLIGLFTD